MDAQQIRISLHDDSGGYEITPDRVPLSVLRNFANDVDEFLRGERGGLDTSELDVAVVKGSLAVLTAPTAHPSLLHDLLHLASSEVIDGLNAKRRAVVERWQKAALGSRKQRIEIRAPMLTQPIVIGAGSDYRADDADQWVRVERYLHGEIYEIGGLRNVNAHIRLPDGKSIPVEAQRDVLRADKTNRLYKTAMLRIAAEYNVATRDYRNAKLIEFVEHESKLDEKDLERLTQRGAKAWQDVPDAGAWVDSLRGNDA
jgi:hypothetical protein